MGIPPDTHVQKKLIRKYFKFGLKRTDFDTTSKYYIECQKAWSKSGMYSLAAGVAQEKIDRAFENDEKEFKDMKRMIKDLPYKLNQSMPKIKPKIYYKGKHRDLAAYERHLTKKDVDLDDEEHKML